MGNDVRERQEKRLAPWAVAVGAAIVTWLLWVFGAEGYLFRPDITVSLLGISIAVNVGLATYLLTSRR